MTLPTTFRCSKKSILILIKNYISVVTDKSNKYNMQHTLRTWNQSSYASFSYSKMTIWSMTYFSFLLHGKTSWAHSLFQANMNHKDIWVFVQGVYILFRS